MFNKVAKVITGMSVLALILTVFFSQSSLSQDSSNPDTIVLSATNTVSLNAVVDGDSVGQVLSDVKALRPKKDVDGKCHIRLFLNTPGGSIQSGLELIEALNGNDCTVDTITMFAASMGFQIAQNLGERMILKNGTLMSHRAKGGFQGEFGGQTPSQVSSRVDFWNARIQEMDEQTVKRTNGKQTLASYQAQYANELWMTGTQSTARGYADRVVSVKCDKTLSGAITHNIEFMGVPISFDLDKCPLNTSPQNVKIGQANNMPPLSPEKTREIKDAFITSYLGKQHQVVPMTW